MNCMTSSMDQSVTGPRGICDREEDDGADAGFCVGAVTGAGAGAGAGGDRVFSVFGIVLGREFVTTINGTSKLPFSQTRQKRQYSGYPKFPKKTSQIFN